jgi:hypothetical protein
MNRGNGQLNDRGSQTTGTRYIERSSATVSRPSRMEEVTNLAQRRAGTAAGRVEPRGAN